ncbi:MAG: TRAP transporter substrate-binding protein DctP, partial [Lachnospiraceae bacterium]|nr:TRAP transporter substrate-binding protein DctP [Lachnospiraceae bacterium]
MKRKEKKMKKIFLQIVALVLSICVLTACGSSNSSIEEDTVVENEMDTEGADEQNAEIRELSFQIGHIDAVTDDDHADVLCRAFADKAAELSDGKIQIEVIGAAALGNEAETVEGMALGTISAAIIGNTILTGYVPDLEIFDLPYLVTNREEAAAIFNNKEIMSYFDDQVYDIASIKILARGECGFRNYVSNVRPITQLSDLNGIKIR